MSYDAVSQDQLRAIYQGLSQQLGWSAETRELTLLFVGIGLALAFLAAGASLLWQHRLP
jgi:Ca-activated chloride channel family protein